MFGIVVMFMCVLVFYNKMSAQYILTTKAQTWTDALGDAAACWSSERGGFNKDEALDKFNEMKHFAIEDFSYYADFKIDFDNEHNGLYDIIYVSCTFEYPWFASTSSQQAFHSVLTYPKKTVSTQLNYIHIGNEDIIQLNTENLYDTNINTLEIISNYLDLVEQNKEQYQNGFERK